jgi:hypothetical protein
VKSPPLAPVRIPPLPRVEKLWGAQRIADVLGVGVDTVVTLARRADCPIYQPSGRYFALRSELDQWLRTKPGESGEKPAIPEKTRKHRNQTV